VIMAGDFDPLDRDSWYFGVITREESVQILKDEREGGVFLVRDSTSIPGDYVLCVKEVCVLFEKMFFSQKFWDFIL
jgi:C-crk adapter molecule crk